MGLLTILRKIKKKEKEIRILILGLDNAGKTTIVKKLLSEDINTISPTFGFQIRSMEFKGYKLNIWDVGGQQTIRTYQRNYYEQTDGLIQVIDSNDLRRLNDCKIELHRLLGEERLAGASLLIFFNKADLNPSITCEDIEKILELKKMVNSRRYYIQSSSAVTGLGLNEGVSQIVNDISSRIFSLFK